MGHSVTINCIGQKENGYLEYAMSKLEVYQKTILYSDISYWYNQTGIGRKILGADLVYRNAILSNPPKSIINCICKISCPLCLGSQKTTKQKMKNYQSWQIEEFKRR